MKAMIFFKSTPSRAQAEAGNYRKRKIRWQGLDISIENDKDATRRGYNPDGSVAWKTTMQFPYGYIRRTVGTDGEHVDCYVGDDLETAKFVYIVHQRRAGDWVNYDEDKAMIGFGSRQAAIAGYLTHYNDPRFMGEISVLPVAEFVRRVKRTPKLPKAARILIAS